MICPYCGRETPSGSKFCISCGAALNLAAALASAPSAAFRFITITVRYQDQSDRAGALRCLSAAWRDITCSPRWMRRTLLLMACNTVPILDLFAKGYGIRWGTQAASGVPGPPPRSAFDARCVLLGFMYAVATAVIAAPICLLGKIGFDWAGWLVLVLLALGIFVAALIRLAVMRAGVLGCAGEAFELSDLVTVWRKGGSGVLVSSFLPSLIVGGIWLFTVVITALIFTAVGYAQISAWNAGVSLQGSGLLMAERGISIGIIVFRSFLEGFADLLAFRAIGHWIRWRAPQWPAGSEVST